MTMMFAKVDAFVGHNGVPVRIQVGEVYDSDNELVKAHPEFFEASPAEGVRPKKRTEPTVVGGAAARRP